MPQGYHADGKAADLPPLPDDEADDDEDESPESAETRPSPQAGKSRKPDPSKSAKLQPTGDTAMRKAQFTITNFPAIPSVFQPVPAVGLQFLLPIKPISLKLPFNRRLEIEIYGRVDRPPESTHSFRRPRPEQGRIDHEMTRIGSCAGGRPPVPGVRRSLGLIPDTRRHRVWRRAKVAPPPLKSAANWPPFGPFVAFSDASAIPAWIAQMIVRRVRFRKNSEKHFLNKHQDLRRKSASPLAVSAFKEFAKLRQPALVETAKKIRGIWGRNTIDCTQTLTDRPPRQSPHPQTGLTASSYIRRRRGWRRR